MLFVCLRVPLTGCRQRALADDQRPPSPRVTPGPRGPPEVCPMWENERDQLPPPPPLARAVGLKVALRMSNGGDAPLPALRVHLLPRAFFVGPAQRRAKPIRHARASSAAQKRGNDRAISLVMHLALGKRALGGCPPPLPTPPPTGATQWVGASLRRDPDCYFSSAACAPCVRAGD
jgi:hypothetical protein